jgi:hypothetical protein
MPRNVRQRCGPRIGAGSVVLLLIALGSLGCSHTVLVRTAPEGAVIAVDGDVKGESPLVVETRSGVFDTMSITAELEGFSSKRVLLEQTEWFLWPGLLAVTPLLMLPLVVVFPPFGAIVALAWAVVTSPSLLSLAFIRTYPNEVVIELEPRQADESLEFLPTDWWTVPEEYAPNPPPTPPPDATDAPLAPPGPPERDDASPSPG